MLSSSGAWKRKQRRNSKAMMRNKIIMAVCSQKEVMYRGILPRQYRSNSFLNTLGVKDDHLIKSSAPGNKMLEEKPKIEQLLIGSHQ